MKIKKICKQCGKEFEIDKKYLSDEERKTCSKKCRYELMGKKREKPKIKKICEYCKKEFLVHSYREKIAKYCSMKCRDKNRSKLYRGRNHPNWKGGEIKKICEQCGKEFWTKKAREKIAKYCSMKCQFYSMEKSKIRKICNQCGKEFWVYLSNNVAKYCSNECSYKGRLPKIKYKYWHNEKYIFKFFKSILFGRNYKPTELDREIIWARVRLFKIQRKEVKTDETSRL